MKSETEYRVRKDGVSYLAGWAGLSFGGRPFPRTPRMASRAENGYTGECVIGFIPARESLTLTVPSSRLSKFASSSTVNPSMLISINIMKYFVNRKYFRYATFILVE